jgi:hypothetical protein
MTGTYVLILTIMGAWADSTGYIHHIDGFRTVDDCIAAGALWSSKLSAEGVRMVYTATCVRLSDPPGKGVTR